MALFMGILFILFCLLLIAVVLLQKGRGSGLSGAFGGAGGHSAFGSRTGDMFTWVTVGLVVLFLGTGATAVLVFRPDYVGDEPAVDGPMTPLPGRPAVGDEPPPAPPGELPEQDRQPVDEPGLQLDAVPQDSPTEPAE